MTRTIHQVAVFGLGKVGELVAVLLGESGFKVIGYDSAPRGSIDDPSAAFEVKALDVKDADALRESLRGVDAVVSCLPYHLNIDVAEAAYESRTHYFDLTEDVPTTNRVIELSRDHAVSGPVFAPQCGLAPGLIGIVGASLAAQFEQIRSIELKVGALPQNPTGLLGYAFNWSAEGVVNEYLNDCEVLRSGHRQMVPAMTEKERVFIGGIELEAALTSGGLGTMCQTYEGRATRLDYKTLRYPGHFRQMHFLFDELNLRDRRDLVGQLLVDAKPPVNDDIVYLHAAVEGVGPRRRRSSRSSNWSPTDDYRSRGSSSRRTSRWPICSRRRPAPDSNSWERCDHAGDGRKRRSGTSERDPRTGGCR